MSGLALPEYITLDSPPRNNPTEPLQAAFVARYHYVNDHRPEATMVTASQTSGVTPASDYYWRAPSPPHIHIPPTPEDKTFVLPAYRGPTCDENNEILTTITRSHYAVKVTDWKYEWRRRAQGILAFLHLGPSSAARDIEYLRSEGITMLLVIRDTTTATANLLNGKKATDQLGIECKTIDVRGNQELIRAFPRAIETINNHLVEVYRQRGGIIPENLPSDVAPTWGKILVFCESGNERSATIVAAYLMKIYGLDLVSAIQYIQTQRFCVAFDDGLKNLLFNYQQLLEAERSVSMEQQVTTILPYRNGQPIVTTREKRSRDEVEDDMEMDDGNADDVSRFEGRTPFAPFLEKAIS